MRFSKSEVGLQAFKARSPLLSARQRSAFILFDGVKSSVQVLAATVGLGITRDDIEHLVQQGFLLTAPGLATAPVSLPGAGVTPSSEALDAASPAVPLSAGAKQACYSAAMLIATKLTASLGLRGFRLNLAVEAAAGYDDLLALLPRIQDAVGVKPCLPLAKALKG